VSPHISEDGLVVAFNSNRPGGAGLLDIYIARRAADTVPFDPPVAVTELNTNGTDAFPWLSGDGCRLYFMRVSERARRSLQRRTVAPSTSRRG
jgi:hypothetical protein